MGLVASVVLAIALAVTVTFAWGYGNVEQVEANGPPPAALVVDKDGQVALSDVIIMLHCLWKVASDTACESSDINGDGQVTLVDLVRVMAHFGEVVGDDQVSLAVEPAPAS